MYEELIASLRERAETRYDGKTGNEARVYKTILSQAADAIEELQAINQRQLLEIAVLSKPKWISVEKRLPKAFEEVILRFPNNQAAGFVDRDGCWGVYSGDGYYTEVVENEPKPTHWAKKLTEPPKEETI